MIFLFLKLLIIFLAANVQAGGGTKLHLIYTSDTHGTIQPCKRCPGNVRGGYSARGYVVDSLRILHSNSLVVIDGGDFSAGSPYDQMSEGIRKLDSIRTVLSLRAMNQIGYDAIGLGDNDLRWGKDFLRRKQEVYRLPLVSLSYRDSLGGLVGAPFAAVEKNGETIIITSVGAKPDDEILGLGYAYQPIFESLQELFSNIPADKYKVLFLINHAGEDSLPIIEKSLRENNFLSKTVILNAHKKVTPTYLFFTKEDSVPVVNFDYMASRISYAKIAISDVKVAVEVNPIDVLASAGENNRIKKMIDGFEDVKKNFLMTQNDSIEIELFINTTYQNTANVLRDIMPFIVQNEAIIDFTIRYLDNQNIDFKKNLASTAMGDWDDVVFQVALQLADKSRFWAYLASIHLHNRTDRYAFLQNVEFDTASVRAVIETAEFKNFFDTDKKLIKQFGLRKSDYAVFVNGQQLKNFESAYDIQLRICSFYSANFCAEIPECTENIHCADRGLTGFCQANICSYVRDPFFTFNVIGTNQSFNGTDTNFISTIEKLFPSARIRYKDAGDSVAQALIKSKNITRLPFYYTDNEFKESANFKFFATSFVDAGDYLFFDKNNYIPHYKLDSTPIFGNVEVYIDINSSMAKDSVMLISAIADLYATGRISKVNFFTHSSNSLSHQTEEVQRAQFIHNHYPRGALGAYLRNRVRNIESSYWHRSLDAAKIDYRKFLEKFSTFSHTPKQFDALLQSEPLFMLINNNEYVIIRSFADLFRVMRFVDKSHDEYNKFSEKLELK